MIWVKLTNTFIDRAKIHNLKVQVQGRSTGNINTGWFAIAYLVEHWIHRLDCCNKTRKPERVPCRAHQCGGWFWELVWHCIRTGMSLFGEGWGGIGHKWVKQSRSVLYRICRKLRNTNIYRDHHAIACDDLSDQHLSLHFRSPINTDEARAIFVCHHIHGKVHIKITVCSRRKQLWCQMFHRTADARVKCKCSIWGCFDSYLRVILIFW